GYNREITYFLKDDLDQVRTAQAKRVQVPTYPGLVHVTAATEELGISGRTLRREFGDQAPATDKPAKSKDGRPLPRSYVPREFVEDVKARRDCHPGQDDIGADESADILKLTRQGVHSLVRYGVLHPKEGRIVCKGGYPRKAMVFSRAEVERYA